MQLSNMASTCSFPSLVILCMSKSGVFDIGNAQLRTAGELLEAIQQGAAGQGCGGEGKVDSGVTESAAEDSAETIS